MRDNDGGDIPGRAIVKKLSLLCAEKRIELNYSAEPTYFVDEEKAKEKVDKENGPFFVDTIFGSYRNFKIRLIQNPKCIVSATLTACVLAHELGHHYDISKMKKGEARLYSVSLQMRDTLKSTKKKWPTLRRSVFDGEDRAWSHAFEILTKLGYSEWEFFFAVRDYCLGSYKNTYHIR